MRTRRWAVGAVALTTVLAGASLAQATPRRSSIAPITVDKVASARVDRALGNGLGRLVQQSQGAPRAKSSGFQLDQKPLSIRDAEGRVLVDVTPQAGADRAVFRRHAESLGLHVRDVDKTRGTLEGFIAVKDVTKVASLNSLGTIAQAVKPHLNVGKATSQGVAFQRVTKVHARNIKGQGITIGALSDSFNTATKTIAGDPLKDHAADDVRSGDLPGKRNKQNRKPVVVIQDDPSTTATDEGRAMLQIAHDVAPKAKLCFATADGGDLNFADNIRKLADKSGPCRADVVVDDVTYFDEPMFSDSVISDAIDAVAAKGTHYFTSAGNEGEQKAWASKVQLLRGAREAKVVKRAGLDFSQVDPSLYDGGLQDMNPGRGTDVAQDATVGKAGGVMDMQWNDPVDLDGTKLSDPIFTATGNLTKAQPSQSFNFTPNPDQVGKRVQFRTDAIPSGTTDLILSVTAPDGANLGTVNSGTSPEQLVVKLQQPGAYTITISGSHKAAGDFAVDVREVLSPSRVSTDFNLLFFGPDGSFLGSSADNNRLSGRPSELSGLPPIPRIQIVISRAGTGPAGATRIRNVLFGDMGFTEYVNPLAPAIFGHPTARGATGVAAIDPFRPFLPESFTSPGGDLPIYFKSNGDRYAHVRIRRTPRVTSTDRVNTTFFVADDARDRDPLPNFGGTSAAAPHAAAIAALTLQRAGGPGSLSPRALRLRLERSTFKHDLDPDHAAGRSHGLRVVANGEEGRETLVVPGPMNDPRFFTVRYTGRVPLRSVKLLGETASPTALGHGRTSAGIVFDRRAFHGKTPFRDDGLPFKVGATSGGLRAGSVVARFTARAPAPSVKGQFRHLKVVFRHGLRHGQAVKFGVDRDLAISGFGGSNEGNGANELGGAVLIPQGRKLTRGMVFKATRVDGSTFTGVIRNRLGHGFSPVDGFGLINAQRAVLHH
ncbi:MAG: hypothetical protein QOF53_1607 [Nocardioidaceae bacterium]|nr:hypothetical protein [Nocardioidaceae bacterium]